MLWGGVAPRHYLSRSRNQVGAPPPSASWKCVLVLKWAVTSLLVLEFSSCCSYSTHSLTRESYYGWTRLGFIFRKCRIVVDSVLERMKNWQETGIFILLCSGITAGRSTNMVQQFSGEEKNKLCLQIIMSGRYRYRTNVSSPSLWFFNRVYDRTPAIDGLTGKADCFHGRGHGCADNFSCEFAWNCKCCLQRFVYTCGVWRWMFVLTT